MEFLKQFQAHLPNGLRKVFESLTTPFAIQEYLDSLAYKGEERDRSPLNVMLDGQGHCLDGGFLAARAAIDRFDKAAPLALRDLGAMQIRGRADTIAVMGLGAA